MFFLFFYSGFGFWIHSYLTHDHEVAQEIMKITKSLAMEVKKSFFIPNNNKQDGNKTLKKNNKHKTVYMAIYLITSCHSNLLLRNLS
jgi:hypothetical protein